MGMTQPKFYLPALLCPVGAGYRYPLRYSILRLGHQQISWRLLRAGNQLLLCIVTTGVTRSCHINVGQWYFCHGMRGEPLLGTSLSLTPYMRRWVRSVAETGFIRIIVGSSFFVRFAYSGKAGSYHLKIGNFL
jgi:hypothetical protein